MDNPPPPGPLDQLRLRFQAALTLANLWVDSTDHNVEQTADKILRRLHKAAVVPADLLAHEQVLRRRPTG